MTLTACWMVVFFFASAGASAAYLTGSEIFPMETRAMALAFCYAVGTGIGGVVGPALFAKLVETGKEVNVFYGYLRAAAVLLAAGVTEWLLGVDAERRSLEDIAAPLTAEEPEAATP
jgi:MFS family permease